MKELDAAILQVRSECGEDTYIMWGTVAPDDAGDRIVVTIIATGLKEQMQQPTYRRVENISPQRKGNLRTDIIEEFKPQLKTPVESGIKIPVFLQGYTQK